MLATFIDIALAFLIARLWPRWWQWLLLSLLAGVLVATTFALGTATLHLQSASLTLHRATADLFTHAIFCALCAWGVVSWVGPIPRAPEDDPPA